jgi:FkbH-like protein
VSSRDQTPRLARQELAEALRAVLPAVPGIAVIHSSLPALIGTEPFGRWDALAALESLVAEGWTICLPAFTFSFCGGKPFDLRSSPSEVGILADWAHADLRDARRTPHPIYSFVVAGPLAAEIEALRPETIFGAGSAFAFFERHAATLVMLGCDWTFCTPLHRYEELAAVPYRHYKDFAGVARLGDSEGAASARMFVRDLASGAQNDFSPVIDALRSRGAIATRALWRGQVEATSVSALAAVCQEQLAADPFAHVKDAAQLAYRLAKRRQKETATPLSIAILGHANVEQLRSAVDAQMEELLVGRLTRTHAVPFGQLAQEVLNPRSALGGFEPEVSIFVDRLEDLIGAASIEGIAPDVIEERVAAYGDLIVRHAAAHKGLTIVFRFALLAHPIGAAERQVRSCVEELNTLLAAKLATLDPLVFVDVGSEAALFGGPVRDSRLWLMGRFPFSEPFSRHLARRCAGIVLAALGKTARLVVLDLDNTLWGGVLGEDGPEGIQLGGDYPGNAFAEFQKALQRLAARGVALALASKNDEELALDTLQRHPAMHLRQASIVSHRINWEPKWCNVKAICDELGLGLESVLFVDDNRVEREQVRRWLPEVKVLDLPDDPVDYVLALESCPWLEVSTVTTEDLHRVDSYRQRAIIEQERRNADGLESFLGSLQMTLQLAPLDPGNSARAVQLCQKTNQFNTTTHRYDKAQLEAIVAAGGDVIVVGLADRFTNLENIGIIVFKPHPERRNFGLIDDFLLSCRVLGRGLETGVLYWALAYAHRRQWKGLGGYVVETERNAPARNVFKEAGFRQELSSGQWLRSSDPPPPVPGWFAVDDRSHRSPARDLRVAQ